MKMNTWMDNLAMAAVIAAIVLSILHGAYLGTGGDVQVAATQAEARHA
jgi:hypothetical protein